MKKSIYLLCALVLSVSCININIGNGKSVTCKGPVVVKDMELSDFSSIVVNGHSDLNFSQADAFSVSVTANEEVFEHLNYHVDNNVLYITHKNNVNIRAEKYEVTVSLPFVESITVNGAADVNQVGGYKAEKDLKVMVNGAGDLSFAGVSVPSLSCTVNGAADVKASALDVDNLSISINGAGDAVLSGKAAKASFSVSGAGDIDARGLECGDIHTSKAGVASIRLGSK